MSYHDHFAALDASRWATLLGASGSLAVTDSCLSVDSPAAGDSAAAYLINPLSKATSQTIHFAFARSITNPATPISIINNSGVPALETSAAFSAHKIIGFTVVNSGAGIAAEWVDSAGVTQRWNPSANAWVTSTTEAISPWAINDFNVCGIEFDAEGGNSRFRMFMAHQTIGAGPSATQGLRMFVLTDWVNWSSARATPDSLYLILGDHLADSARGAARFEYVHLADGARQYAMVNVKEGSNTGVYECRTVHSMDGLFWIYRDRSTVDVSNSKDPCLLDPGTGTFHLWVRQNGTKDIRHYTAASKEGPWVFSDVALSPSGAATYFFPDVHYTPWDIHPWQMLVLNDSEIVYAWAAGPAGPWTETGVAIPLGAAGQADDTKVTGPVAIHKDGQWEVAYTGMDTASTQTTGFRAYGAALNALTRDNLGPRLPAGDSSEALTADLNGNVVSVASTAGFAVDQPIYLDNDATQDNWAGSKVRKISAGSIELYHRLIGYTVASGSKIFGAGGGNQQVRVLKEVGTELWVYMTVFQFARLDGTIAGFQESTMLLRLPTTDLWTMAAAYYDWASAPMIFHGNWNSERSSENISLYRGTTAQSTAPAIGAADIYFVAAETRSYRVPSEEGRQ